MTFIKSLKSDKNIILKKCATPAPEILITDQECVHIAIVDTETTGIDKLNDKIIEIAIKSIDMDKSSGKILSIDINNMKPIENVKFLNCDIFDPVTKDRIDNYFNGNLDVIISDMAADTTGNKSLDSIRTNQLCAEVINFSSKILKNNGVFVSKLFMGEDFIEVSNFNFKSLLDNIIIHYSAKCSWITRNLNSSFNYTNS